MAALGMPATSRSQGPLPSYLANPATELPWASAYIHLDGGSRQRIGFLPLVDVHERAPTGTHKYSRDIRIDAAIVFVGDGIVQQDGFNAYGDLDVTGKVVMFAYDFPARSTRPRRGDSVDGAGEAPVPLARRVTEAAERGAAGVVAFSLRDEAPFPLQTADDPWKLPDMPAIVVGRGAAARILAASGVEPEALFAEWDSAGHMAPQQLIARLDLRIDGAFPTIDRPQFTFAFENGIDSATADALVTANERAAAFAVDLFKGARVRWHKSFVAYFRGFDSKVFYTHHWGVGLSADAGSFMVVDSAASTAAIAVHENTHTLLGANWGHTSSFMNEGFAQYAEAAATRPDTNHAETLAFVRTSRLPPLSALVTLDIGTSPLSDVAYPAAGSFVGYLIATYGLAATRTAWQLEGRPDSVRVRNNTWTRAFGRDLRTLEVEWHRWLEARPNAGQNGKPSEKYPATPDDGNRARADVGTANPRRSR